MSAIDELFLEIGKHQIMITHASLISEASKDIAKYIVDNLDLRKENEQLKEGIKEAVEFINSTHFWEVNSYNTGEYYMRCRCCLNDYKHGGHHKECVVGMWLERWGE